MASAPRKTSLHDGKPTVEKSWDVIMKKVEETEKDMSEGWKDDIDTMLVFAGLFSAVVTAFTIESLKKLSEDSGDTTVALLKRISLQLSDPNRSDIIPLPVLEVSPSYLRINTLWILSLILALVDALFCLVCKQWLREHQRSTKTKTPEELLALRFLRAESFEIWHVPQFLAALPIMLEVALFLFFAGLLELLWMQKHHVLFSLAIATVGVATLFYIGTTFLPTIDIIRQVFSIHPGVLKDHESRRYSRNDQIFMIPSMHHLCAYKSPQALLVLRMVSNLIRLLRLENPLIRSLRKKFPENGFTIDIKGSLAQNIYDLTSWSSADVNLVQRFSRIPHCPDMYALKAFRSIIEEFRDMPAMIPHLRNVLKEQQPHSLMAAVFDRGMFKFTEDWDVEAVEKAIEGKCLWWWKNVPFEFSAVETQLLYYHNLWINDKDFRPWAGNPPFEWTQHEGHFSQLQLHVPMIRVAPLLKDSRTIDFGIKILEHNVERTRTQVSSGTLEVLLQLVIWFLGSLGERQVPDKDKFLRGVFLINKQLANSHRYKSLPHVEAYQWLDALDRLRGSLCLPKNYFTHIDNLLPISFHRLNEKMLKNPSVVQEGWIEDLWDACSTTSAYHWLHYLSQFVYTNISPIALSGGPLELKDVDWLMSTQDSLNWQHTLDVPKTSFPLLISDTFISFLHSLNDKIRTYEHSGHQYQPYAWIHILRCIRKFNNKPSGFFHRIRLPPVVRKDGQFAPKADVVFGGLSRRFNDKPSGYLGRIPMPPIRISRDALFAHSRLAFFTSSQPPSAQPSTVNLPPSITRVSRLGQPSISSRRSVVQITPENTPIAPSPKPENLVITEQEVGKETTTDCRGTSTMDLDISDQSLNNGPSSCSQLVAHSPSVRHRPPSSEKLAEREAAQEEVPEKFAEDVDMGYTSDDASDSGRWSFIVVDFASDDTTNSPDDPTSDARVENQTFLSPSQDYSDQTSTVVSDSSAYDSSTSDDREDILDGSETRTIPPEILLLHGNSDTEVEDSKAYTENMV